MSEDRRSWEFIFTDLKYASEKGVMGVRGFIRRREGAGGTVSESIGTFRQRAGGNVICSFVSPLDREDFEKMAGKIHRSIFVVARDLLGDAEERLVYELEAKLKNKLKNNGGRY